MLGMDYLPRLGSLTADLDLHQKATAVLAWALSRDTYLTDNAQLEMRRRGFGRFLTKAGDVLESTDPNITLGPLNSALLALVDQESILGRLRANRMALGASVRLQVGDVTTSIVDEGEVKPITRLGFDLSTLPPQKVVTQIIVSSEALRAFDIESQNGLRAMLVSAVANATDVALIAALTSGSPTSGATVGELLAAISGGAPRRPVIIGDYQSFLTLDPGIFQTLQALGVLIATTPAAAGLLIAVDGAGLLVGDDGIVVQTARHADVWLEDGSSPSTPVLTSLWHTNLSAIRAERFFRLAIRAGAAAYASTGSPA
jgi:hypothetical protein